MKMKVIFLQNKRKLVLWLLAATLLLGILTFTVYVKLLDYKDQLLVIPTASNSLKINAEALEKINGESFLLTYEILSQERVQTLNENSDGTIRKTNYAYPYVMHKKLLTGSFFTEQDQKEKKKAAILNKTAAYKMFGNTDICGSKVVIGQDEFTITGVIDDGRDKESNVYIPAVCSGENPSSFAVQMEDDLTEAWIKNECKAVVSTERGYHYICFGTLADLVLGLFFIFLKIGAIVTLLLLLKKSDNALRESRKKIRQLSERFYFKELIRNNSKEVMKAASIAAAMISMVILALGLAFSFMDYFMLLNDTISQFLIERE